MNRTMKPLVLIAFSIVALVSCSSSEYDSPDAAPAALDKGPDPTVVDRNHYKSEFENDRVRLVRITYGPSEASTMHYHPDSVAIFLTDQHVEMGLPDGSSKEIHTKPGEHLFIPAGHHLPKNIGTEMFELVLVELKGGGSAVAKAGPDPTVVDAGHYAAEFENDRVRVVRITYGPGEESVMHYHPDSVGVFLTDNSTLMKMPDGSSEEMHVKAAQHIYAPAGQHLPKSIGDSPMELILVELK